MLTACSNNKEKLVLVTETGFAPYEYYDNGELVGIIDPSSCGKSTLLRSINFLEKPTSVLDPEMIGEVTNLMRQITKEGITMIIVSDEMNFIRKFCTRVLYMEDGNILCDGTQKEIFEHPGHDELKKFLSKINNI